RGRQLPEQIEAGHEPLIEHRDLAVEDQRASVQLPNGASDVGEARGVIPARATDELNVSGLLVRDDAPPVDLFLVDPPAAMEGSDERRDGGRDAGQIDGGHRAEYHSGVN